MKQNLKTFFAELAGVDPSQIETSLDDEDFDMEGADEEEALKAQAVAARTETLYKVENGPVANHPEADICDDVNCCQAFLPAETAEKNWGKQAKKYAATLK